MLAVDVGDRCSVIGCDCPETGLGKARTCDMKFISKNRACSSMTVERLASQSSEHQTNEIAHTFPIRRRQRLDINSMCKRRINMQRNSNLAQPIQLVACFRQKPTRTKLETCSPPSKTPRPNQKPRHINLLKLKFPQSASIPSQLNRK